MNTREYLKTYNILKRKYDDAIVLVKADEKYITFKEDAQIVSEVLQTRLNITETAIPTYTAFIIGGKLERCLNLLIKKGFRVAVCENSVSS